MLYVKRGKDGLVVAISREEESESGGWETLAADSLEVIAFAGTLVGAGSSLAGSDMGLTRVIEDLIDLLIEQDTIRFTDFPGPAQAKLLKRRSMRISMRSLNLLHEESEGGLI